MGKKNSIDSRPEDEKLEAGKVLDSNVPGDRFQDVQQVNNPVEENMGAKVDNNGFVPKKSGSKGSQLKQEQVARVITGTGGVEAGEGVASPSRAGLRTLAYSGNEGTILGSSSGTPVVGSPSRSDTRPGQKLDAVAKAIDFVASEQVIQEFDGSKPLQENPTEVQGFLGHPENAAARLQKTAEAVPGALLYARSCDEIRRDEIAYVEGQMVQETDVEYKVTPTRTYDPITQTYKPYAAKRGNFIPKTMHIGVKANGQIHAITFDVDDVSITASAAIVNKASSAFIRAMNIDEINRQNMEKVAGIETQPNWCPVVRAVDQPTPTIGELTDNEITTGSEMFMAYRFVNKASAYFFNKAAKDGQTPYRSFREMLYGLSRKYSRSKDIPLTGPVFDRADYCHGAPSLMIPLYDSIAKYSKRGDLPTQPRSWKMHKQTADNNINPFMVDPTFAKYVANRDTFSTIDRGYDPFLPVCITDNWRLSHVRDFNSMMNFTHAKVFKVQMGGKGTSLAGTEFNTVFDALIAAPTTVGGRIAAYSSGAVQTGTVYNFYHLTGANNYGNPVIKTVGTKTGFDTDDDGFAAAIEALFNYDHSGNNNQLKPVIILYKVKGTIDDVYAICRAPGIIDITTSANIKVYAGVSTGYDNLASDTSKNTTLVRDDELNCDIFTYKYQNRQNPYIVEVRNPLLYAIKEWATNMGAKLANPAASAGSTEASSLRDAQGVLWYDVPIVHSTTSMSLWDLIVCASVPFAQKIRTNSMFDVLNYQDNNGKYPFEQLVSIKEANPLATVNYGFKDMLQPLTVSQMKSAVALSWIIPEKFWRIDHTVTEGALVSETFVLPYYYSEEQFHFVQSGGSIICTEEEEGFVMNYPTTRAGARLGYLDDFYGMTERDVRLSLDMMVTTPGFALSKAGVGVYKYGLSNSGVPVFEYSGGLHVGELLRTPRELGLGFVAPYGYNSCGDSKYVIDGAVSQADYTGLLDLVSLGSSYTVRTWKVLDGQYKGLHDALSVVVNRAGNFAQEWNQRGDAIYAPSGEDYATVDTYGVLQASADIGICLNFNDIMEVGNGIIAGEAGKSVFKPFTKGGLVHNNSLPDIITLQNALWPRLQMMPFAISPFDQTPEARKADDEIWTADMNADPYDFIYIFGFCGFKGSDFREDAFNRIYERQTLGWTFVKDPFVEASPVLK